MTDVDVAVIGGGCIGCAIARRMADDDLAVAVLEKEATLASHQSGRNSGVLHPGVNYPPGSLKARFATEGTRRMKTFASRHDVPLAEHGVVVVATTPHEERRLDDLEANARANDVSLRRLEGPAAIHGIEPHAAGRAGLYCPAAASIDSRAYVQALADDARRRGVQIHLGRAVTGLAVDGDEVTLQTASGPLSARCVVNAAGLQADRLAHRCGVGREYRIVPFRGEYYRLAPERRSLTRTMIYPTPSPDVPFLGVHFTRRTDGSVIVGPNAVMALGREAYRTGAFDPGDLLDRLTAPHVWRLLADPIVRSRALRELHTSVHKRAFVRAARHLVPAVTAEDLRPGFAGNRAQVVGPEGSLIGDPLVEHGERSTHVLNAVSPGLTSSLPFGDHVAEAVLERLE